MTPQQLKNSILQMAMQGKLVEQRPEEGTGEELYQQIQKEKQKLIKEGKIKKEKPLPKITEDEVPFEIPESWKWVRLGDISSYSQPKTKITPSEIKPEMWSLDLEDIEKNSGKVIVHTRAANRKIAGDKVCFKKGDILYSKLRPYLMKILIAENDGITTPEIIPFGIYGCNDQRFYLWLLRSPYVDAVVNSVSYGVKMPRVGTGTMVNLLVPLPPLAEQKRIVAKIEEIMPFIDRYATAYNNLQSYNTRFPDDLKKSILQQAMEGKLSSQWREDNRVDINSWHKMTVADACHEVKVGIVIRPTRYYTDSTGYKAFRSTNVREFHVQNSDWVYINQKGQDENPRTVVHTGDVLIVRSGNTGTACVVPEEYDGCSGIDIIIAVPNKQIIDPEFLCIFTNSPVGKTQINSGTKGMALTHFGAKSYAKLSINVPSLEEQHYIVEQVKRILPKITMLSRVS